MAQHRPIVIDVKDKSVPNGMEARWQDFTGQMPVFTADIKTPALDSASDLSSVVSGMPTIFARANLFRLAIEYIQAPNNATGESTEGLMRYYETLVDEWRGFIACLALDYTRIRVQRIELAYSDGKTIDDTANVYEPKGAFGNMLFERKELWKLQGEAGIDRPTPFIDVIQYEGLREDERNIIGAASPDSLLFTSPNYSISSDHPFVNKQTHKFTDPLKASLDASQALTLLAYVEHIIARINRLAGYYGNLPDNIRPDYAVIGNSLSKWQKEIKAYCEKRHYDINTKSIPTVDKFQEPYNLLFNYSANLYGFDGVIYEDEGAAGEHRILFDPRKVLLPPGSSEIARIEFSNSAEMAKNPSLLAQQPVYALKAKIKNAGNEYAYFALPITALGLNVFGKNIGALTEPDNTTTIKSRLTAEFDPMVPSDNLEVTLAVETVGGKTITIKEAYSVKQQRINNKDLLLWPNFIEGRWTRYFLYSEMPHNGGSHLCPFAATPIVGKYEDNDFRILVDESGDPLLLAKSGRINQDAEMEKFGLEAKLHVVSDSRISDNAYKYEIYESNLPFKGVKLSSGSKDSGYLVIRYTTDPKLGLPVNEMGFNRTLTPATVGIDFGSTNTSVAFSADGRVEGISFKNHRVSLLQSMSRNTGFCRERDLFFFQSKEIEGNAIKSILTLHDVRRLNETGNAAASKEVSGGMPCFDPSMLPVESVNEKNIVLQCSEVGQAILVHNMKWSERAEDVANKKAFLRSLMLHIYAELFSKSLLPTVLKWSYPSAMSQQLIIQYGDIWNDLQVGLSPVKGETLEVCKSDIYSRITTAGTFGAMAEKPIANNNAWGGGTDFSSGLTSGGGFGGSFNAPQSEPARPTRGNGWAQDDGSRNALFAPLPSEDLEPDNNEVDFKFIPVDPGKCLTEACAVANFSTTNDKMSTGKDSLTLCFDIGGSTTDISAIINNGRLVLIKQNSIKFAAQRVSEATRVCPALKGVLRELCEKQNIKIPGLNIGEDKFTPETASFFFEQVIDRLDAEGLSMLYHSIGAKCPDLMSVNLYVTGLIIYYAGQLTNKLVNVLRTSLSKQDPFYADFTPNVNVTFAGKGSRIFEWFSTTQNNIARDYYTQMFIRGLGGMEVARQTLYGPPAIQLDSKVSTDVKYEVSKGLALKATTPLLQPDGMQAIEILGEDNFVITKASTNEEIPLAFDNAVTEKMFDRIGQDFKQRVRQGQFACARFADFCDLFYGAATQIFGLKLTQADFVEGFQSMQLDSYISNLPEYRKAKEARRVDPGKPFDFVAPIIILEGMKFYDDVLMKKL